MEQPRLYKTSYSILWVIVILVVALDLSLILISPFFSVSAARGVASAASAQRMNFDYLFFGLVAGVGYTVAVFETWRNNRGFGDFFVYFVVFNFCFISLTWVVQYLVVVNIGVIKGLLQM